MIMGLIFPSRKDYKKDLGGDRNYRNYPRIRVKMRINKYAFSVCGGGGPSMIKTSSFYTANKSIKID